MSRDLLIKLMAGYGYKIEREFLAEYKTRFRNEEGNGLIDVWRGRKGVTIGVYNPNTRKMWYRRNAKIKDVKDALIQVEKYYQITT